MTSPRIRGIGVVSPWSGGRSRLSVQTDRSTVFCYAAVLGLAAVLGYAAGDPARLRIALAGGALALAVALAARAGPGLLYLLVIWTAVLGTVRRLLSSATGAGQADPLLLIAVGGLVVLVVAAAERGAFGGRSRLATSVLLINLLTFFEAFNPEQGGLRAGFTGLVFLLVPVLAFWIGRGLLTTRSVTVVCRLLAALAIPVAVYGLIQTFGRFPPWDQRWILDSGYSALSVGGKTRAFASFASGQEYALYLAVGIVVWLVLGLTSRRVLLVLPVIALLGVALFYESSRTPLVLAVFACGLVLASTRLRNPAVTIFMGILAVAVIPTIVSHFAPSAGVSSSGVGSGASLAEHQLGGLSNPFSSKTSTLSDHFSQLTNGFTIMIHHPLGLGGAVVNLAGAKAGSGTTNTEYDPSNIAIALGVPGLLLYLVILVESVKLAIRRAGIQADFAARCALGIIIVTVLEWSNGGLYSVAFLPWLLMGWLDHEESRERVTVDVEGAVGAGAVVGAGLGAAEPPAARPVPGRRTPAARAPVLRVVPRAP